MSITRDAKIEAIDLIDEGKELLVSTEGLYRIIEHKPDGSQEIDDELLDAAEALSVVEIHNNLRRKNGSWYEAVSYGRAYERQEKQQRCDDIAEGVERRLAARKNKKKAAKKNGKKK